MLPRILLYRNSDGASGISELVPVPYRLIGWNQDGEPIVTEKEKPDRFHSGATSGHLPVCPAPRPHLDRAGSLWRAHAGHFLPLAAVGIVHNLVGAFCPATARHSQVGKTGSEDDKDRRVLEAAISYATQLGGIVISGDSSLELKEAAKDAGEGSRKA